MSGLFYKNMDKDNSYEKMEKELRNMIEDPERRKYAEDLLDETKKELMYETDKLDSYLNNLSSKVQSLTGIVSIIIAILSVLVLKENNKKVFVESFFRYVLPYLIIGVAFLFFSILKKGTVRRKEFANVVGTGNDNNKKITLKFANVISFCKRRRILNESFERLIKLTRWASIFSILFFVSAILHIYLMVFASLPKGGSEIFLNAALFLSAFLMYSYFEKQGRSIETNIQLNFNNLEKSMSEQQPKQIQMKANEEELKGRYSNGVQIYYTKEEFILDFVGVLPLATMLNSRVILSPRNYKIIVKAMEDDLKKYEEQFNQIAE